MEPEAGSLPRSLRAIALFYVFLGTTALLFLLFSLLREEVRLDLSFLLIWLGIALLKRSEGARWWGALIAWFLAGGGGLFLVISLATSLPLEWRIEGKFVMPAPRWAVALLGGAVLVLGLSVALALRRLARRGLFRVPRGIALDRRSRLQVLAAMAASLVLSAAGVIWWRSIPDAEDEGWTINKGPERLFFVGHGTRCGKLAYVVFARAEGYLSHPIRRGRPGEAYLEKPDGTRILLPGEHQLYEVSNGILRSSDRRVSREELEAFLDSHPEEYTLDALLEFVEGLRAGV
jgi:hypothetical protein